MARICPTCQSEVPLASHTRSPGIEPQDGDVSICIKCGNFSIFEGDHLRKPNFTERMAINESAEAQRTRRAWAITVERGKH